MPISTAPSVAPLVHCCGKQNQVVEEGEEGRQLAKIHSTISSILFTAVVNRTRWLRREEGRQLANIHSTISSTLSSLLW